MKQFLRWTLLLFLYGGVAQAQVTVSNVTPSPACAGSNVTFSYTNQFGPVSQTNIFLNGPSTSNLLLKTIPSGSSGSIQTVTIPADRLSGTYTIQVRDQLSGSVANTAGFTVNAQPAAPITSTIAYCQNATGVPPLTATGQNLRWYTAASGGTAFTSITPSTSTVGQTNYYVSQTINGCEGPRATLTITINPLPNAPTTTNISYCQNATAAPLTATGQNLRWYTAASGGTPSSSVTPLTTTVGSTTYYVSQTDNNSCESGRTPLTVTINPTPPAPTAANTAVAYCQNTTAQPLQATASSGNTLNWYNSQGTALGSTAPTPPTTNPGTTFYQVSQRSAGGCESPRVQIAVTINALPPAPATSPASACQGGATVSLVNSVTAQPGNTLKWYTSPTSASLAAAPQVQTTSAAAPVTYYVSQTNTNGCESSRAAITYTVYALPNAPAVQSPVTYCQNAVAQPLQATPSQGGTLNFYTVPAGGVPSVGLTPSTQFSNIYYVSQTVNGCESSTRAAITVIINALPPSPAVATPITYCQFATSSPLSATATTNNTLVWYATNGQQLGGAPTPPTTTAGVTSYAVSQRDPLGCISESATITVTINAKPTAPATAPLSACLNTPVPALLTNVTATGTLKWYTVAVGGVGATVAPVLSTAAAGSTTYYVSQTSADGCESDRSAITFTVNSLPSPPIPTPRTVFYCQGAASTPLTASGQNLKWYLTNTTNVSTSSITPSTAFANNVKYYVSQTNANGCESARDSVTVITGSRPVGPTVVSPVTYCQNAAATSLTATAIPNNTLKWYGTDPASTNFTTQPTIPATAAAGTFTYYVTQTDGNGCESDKAGIVVRVNPSPTTPVISPLTVCQNAPTISLLSAVTAGGTLKWYMTATGGMGSTTAPVLSTATATTYTYYVSQTDGSGCESDRAPLPVTVKPLPAAPTVAQNVVPICQSSTPVPLTATASPGGTLTWYDPAGNTYTSISPSTNVVATTVYRVSQTVDGCEGPTTSVSVLVIRKPDAPIVGTSPVYCQLDTPTPLSATGQNLRWYTDPTTTQAIPTPIPSTNVPGTTTYYVTQTDGNGCQSDRASIAVRVKAKPAPPVTTPSSIAFCANAVSSLTATASTGGTLNWYGTSPTGGTASASAPVPSTSIIGAPVNYYVSQTVDGCESDRAAIAVTIKALPVAPAVSATPVVYCQGTTAQPLSATPATNGTLNWYLDPTGGIASPTAFTPSTASSVPPTSYYYVSQTVDGCEGPRATIAVTIQPAVTVSIVGLPSRLGQCAAPITLAGSPVGGIVTIDGIPATQLIPGNLTVGSHTVVYQYTSAGGCSATATASIIIDPLPVATLVNSGPLSCTNSVVTLTAGENGSGVSFRFSAGATQLATPSLATVQTAGVYSVTATAPGGCSAVAQTTVTSEASPGAPSVQASASSTDNQPISVTATGCSGTISWLVQGGSGQSAGAIYTVTQPGTYTISARCSVGNCISADATPVVITIRSGVFAINGVTTQQCQLVDATRGEFLVRFVPQYSGLNGSPVSLAVVNELAATTAPAPYTIRLFADNPVVTLVASQAGSAEVRYSYNWRAACAGNVNPNRPPVALAIPAQSLRQNQPYQLVLTSYFTDPDGQPLSFSASGLPAGIVLTGSQLSGSPTTVSTTSSTITATDPNGLQATTSVVFTVSAPDVSVPPTTGFAITGVNTFSCVVVSSSQRRISFSPLYTGLNGQPVRFRVVNESSETTMAGPYSLQLYTDNPTITLEAIQSDVTTTYRYNWLAGCTNQPTTPPTGNRPPTVGTGLANQTAQVGQGFTFFIPTGTFTDPDNDQLQFSVSGLPAGLTFSAAQNAITGTPAQAGSSTVQVTATDPGGLSTSTSFALTVQPAATTPTPSGFSIAGVTGVRCETLSAGERQLSFSPVYTGLTGAPVSFGITNELATTTAPGPYSVKLYTDNPAITLQATQSGTQATYRFNWLATCATNPNGRQAAAEAGSQLSVVVLGNPVVGESVEVLIGGVDGQSVALRLTDLAGNQLHQQQISQASGSERVVVPVSAGQAITILKVSTASQHRTVRLIRP